MGRKSPLTFICQHCKKVIINKNYRTKIKFCNYQCYWSSDIFRKREKSHRWNGGKTIDRAGYVFVYKPEHIFCNHRGYYQEHRLVMEKHLSRILKEEERIHHINGKKSDNRLKNLKLFKNHTEHVKFHHPPGSLWGNNKSRRVVVCSP